MKKKLFKVLSLMCVLATIFGYTQGYTFATPHSTTPEESKPKILFEFEEERTENSKIFSRSDGKYVSISSVEPIHFKDEDGDWEEIDNTLINGKNEKKKNILHNNSSEIKIELPQLLDENSEVSISKNNYKISFKLLETKSNSYYKVISESKIAAEEGSIEEKLNEINTESIVEYSEIINNTDIVYDIIPNGLKESIIIKNKPQKGVSYSYEISSEELTPILNKDNTIYFYEKDDKENPVFVMPAPFMFDSSKNYDTCNDIELILEEKK